MNNLNENELEKLKKLLILRKSIMKSIDNYNMKLYLKQESLKDLNEHICSVYGHSFSDWKEYSDVSIKYYERECLICSKKEIMNYEPVNKKINK